MSNKAPTKKIWQKLIFAALIVFLMIVLYDKNISVFEYKDF